MFLFFWAPTKRRKHAVTMAQANLNLHVFCMFFGGVWAVSSDSEDEKTNRSVWMLIFEPPFLIVRVDHPSKWFPGIQLSG